MPKVDNKDRIICLVSADSGSGKSFFMACLKNAVIYDSDLGGGLTEYEDRIKKNNSERIELYAYSDILADLRARLVAGKLKENVVIDHITQLQQESILKNNPDQSSDFGRSSNKATYEWKKIREFARTFDCNLWCVSHLKAEYEKDKQTGKIPDGAKNIEGDMNIYLRLESAKDDKGRKVYPATAHVIKWRRDPLDARGAVPASFKFTVDEFAKIHGANYLRERDKVTLASPESVAKLTNVIAFMDKSVVEEMTGKWLKAAGVESLEFLSEDQISKCIDFVEKKIKGVK